MHTEYGGLDCDYVFVNLWSAPVGRPLRYGAVAKLVRRLRARTGIEFTPHTLRHSRATELIRAGVAIEVVSKLLTHRSVSATIDRLRRAATAQAVPVPSPQRGSAESLRQRLEAALDEITRLKADNHQLREHLAQHLGHQRQNRIPAPSTTCLPHETQAPNHHSAQPYR